MENLKQARAQRRLVYMSDMQLRAVKACAKRAGTSQAAMFRRGIDLVIAEASGKRHAARGVR